MVRSLTSETDLEGIVMIVASSKKIFQTRGLGFKPGAGEDKVFCSLRI